MADIIDTQQSEVVRITDSTENIVADTTKIGTEGMLNVKKVEDPTFKVLVDKPSSNLTYTGKTYKLDAATSEAVWQITRTYTNLGISETLFANNTKTYDQIWDNRTSLFPPLPFTNNYSVRFDGVNDWIRVNNDPLIDFDLRTQAMTINLWFRSPNSLNGTYIEKMLSNVGYRLRIVNNRFQVEFRGTGGTGDRIRARTDANFGPAVGDSNWHMLTLTYSGNGSFTGLTLYLDGQFYALQQQNDSLTTSTSNTADMGIAARSNAGDKWGVGNIDEVSIWNTQLTAAEVTTIYNSGKPIDLKAQGASPITANLVYWARMGDGPTDTYPTITDVQSGIVGTMLNMTPIDIETVVP